MLILKMKFTSTTHLGKKTRKDLITRIKEKEKKKETSKTLKNEDEKSTWLINAVTGPPKLSPKIIWIVK